MRKKSGFTLIEMLIAAMITAVVMLSVYGAFSSGLFGLRNIDNALEANQSSRLIMDRINLDLENAFVFSKDVKSNFLGDASSVSFLTLTGTYFKEEKEFSPEYSFVSYKLEQGKLTRLCRKNQEALNDSSSRQPEELAAGVDVSFKYGYRIDNDSPLEFKDSWGKEGVDPVSKVEEDKNLPPAVKISLTFTNKKQGKEEFSRTIYLKQI